ncbi:hypothetical protein AMTR_s00063p00214880 [Amborella trichopoda]|uniref:Uncharacterized protein n=1 Tax=Amborella trichopoda TaxID=13333 RepID=U5D1K6_AMBTC|nr:hypothetical protein AMTR_s00063p00214880 [Amborella trichopoda]
MEATSTLDHEEGMIDALRGIPISPRRDEGLSSSAPPSTILAVVEEVYPKEDEIRKAKGRPCGVHGEKYPNSQWFTKADGDEHREGCATSSWQQLHSKSSGCKAEILPVLEFARTMWVDTEKFCQLFEGTFQGTKRVSSAQDVMTYTFPSIIVEKE